MQEDHSTERIIYVQGNSNMLLESERKIRGSEDFDSLPLVTTVIPTYNCSQILPLTLDSVVNQEYPRKEILVIDGGSTDRTVEVLHSYHSKIRLCSAPKYDLFSVINEGVALAKGQYINILLPGDFYIYSKTLLEMMVLAQENQNPDLVYCATLLRNGLADVKFLYRPLTAELLKNGQQPTSLQGCWFKRELFDTLGYFREDIKLRSGFDLFCRLCFNPKYRFASLKRAYVDFDLRGVTSSTAIRHIWETGQMIYDYFGLWSLVKWLFTQREVRRFSHLWSKRLRMAFRERK